RRRLAARRRGPRAPPFGRRPRQFPAVPRPAPALYNAVLRPEGSMRLAKKALTFDDVLLVPAYSEILPRDTSLKTRFTRGIALNLPLVSAAMDTVTEARLAIAIAQEGGIGIVHKNLSPQRQAAEVLKVKRHESGIVLDPITIEPSMKVLDVIKLTQQHRISGLP